MPGRCLSGDKRLCAVEGMCSCDLHMQNVQFDGSGGISRNNRDAGFVPAYLNAETGAAVVSRFADGRPAPVHVLEGLPDDWVAERDAAGCVTSASPVVIAGFLRDGRFFTREAAAQALAPESVEEDPLVHVD